MTAPAAGVSAASHYLWDHWTCRFDVDGLLHRFSLAAPRTLDPGDRHDHAVIHHWTSRDGDAWHYRGAAVEPSPGSFDEHAIWSGCAVGLEDRLLLFYTGVRGPERRQAISLAVSRDGERFDKLGRPVLEPRAHPAYDLGSGDGIMAWRDPSVFTHPETGDRHLLFAARRPGTGPRGAIGHAVAEDQSLERWRLAAPIDLPSCYLQMECPCVLHHDSFFYLVASTKDRAVEDERAANQALRAWRAPTFEGPWEPAGGAGGDLVLDRRARLYAVHVARLGERLAAEGFFTGRHPRAFSWSPWLEVGFRDRRLTVAAPPGYVRSQRQP